MDAREDLDQRGLAGAVVAEQAEHLARADLERDVGEHVGGAERLVDVGQLEQRRVMTLQAFFLRGA